MGSETLPFGLISGGYSCTKQYEWQQLTFRQREQAPREKPQSAATFNYPVHKPNRTERRSPSFDRVCDNAKGADGHIPFNQGNTTQNELDQEDQNLPTDYPGDHFFEIDEARHRSYMDSFSTCSKPDRTSVGRSRQRDEVGRAHTKKSFDEFHQVHPQQRDLSPSDESHDHLDSFRTCNKPEHNSVDRSGHRDEVSRADTKRIFDESHPIHPDQRQLSRSEEFHGHMEISRTYRTTYAGNMLSRNEAKQSLQKNNSNGDYVSRHDRNSRQKRSGNQLSGQKGHKAKKTRQNKYGDQLAGQKAKEHMAYEEQPKGSCSLGEQEQRSYHGGSGMIRNDDRKGNTEVTKEVGYSGAKENFSPKNSSKTIPSLNGSKQSEGVSNMKLESDKRPTFVGFTKRPRNMWTEKCTSPTPPHGALKRGRQSAKRKSEQSFRWHSGSNYNKSSQNRKQGQKFDREIAPEANLGEITQRKEQNKVRGPLSTPHPDAMIQTSQNGCSDTSKMQTGWISCTDTSKVDQGAASHPDSSVRQKICDYQAVNEQSHERGKYKPTISSETKNKAQSDGAKGFEQGILSASKLDKGTSNNCRKKPINISSGSESIDCSDTKNCSKGGDCQDIQGDTTSCNILRNEQVSSALADSEHVVHQKDAEEGYRQTLQATSNQQISQQSGPHRANSGVAKPADRTSHFATVDLNCSPCMTTVEEEFKSSEEVTNQLTEGGPEPRNASKSISAPFNGPAVPEEQFEQPEPNQSTGVIGEWKDPAGSEISDSRSGPPQRSTVEESSTSTYAFNRELGRFIRNILEPLWQHGLLSAEIHKTIVRKAVEKVTGSLGPKVPLTEMEIYGYLSRQGQNVNKLVQSYLDLYLRSGNASS